MSHFVVLAIAFTTALSLMPGVEVKESTVR
jgi:hypothetical protein